MPLIRQEEVYPAAQYPWAQAVEMVAGTGGVAKNDLVIVIANSNTGSAIPQAVKADANTAERRAGVIMVATGKAEANDKFLAVPWAVLTGVNSAVGANSPVYLSETAGEFTVTRPTADGSVVLPVGAVLQNSATEGVVILRPNAAVFEALTKAGQFTVAGTTGTVALGADFDNGTAVAVFAEAPSNSVTIAHVAVSSGTMTVTLSGAPGGSGVKVNYIATSKFAAGGTLA